MRRLRPPLAARLESSGRLSIEGDHLLIRYASDDDDLAARLASPRTREALDQVVAAVLGAAGRWEARGDLPPLPPNGSGPAAEGGEEQAAAPPDVAGHPTVQTVLELFGGRIETVEADEAADEQENA
ncbi:MAG TPA: hypothetical protein VF100_13850 [Thermoanaerobaculia bacterium]